LPGNTGKVYLFFSRATPGDDRTNLTKAIGIVPAPASATTGPFPSVSHAQPVSVLGFDLSHVWIDVETNGDGVIVVASTGESS
jgi:hypothetical protein